MDRPFINDKVDTPDGLGIVKRIEEGYMGNLLYTCVLERPYKILCPWQNRREYGFPKWLFGYTYKESDIKIAA